jgi:hypothetical protein
MLRSRRRFAVAALALALVVAACSTSDDGDDTGTGTTPDTAAPTTGDGGTTSPDTTGGGAIDPGPARGVTDDTINIAVIYGDTKPLEEAGLLPEFGDYEQDFRVFAERINAEGGMGGRQVDISFHPFQAGAPASEQRTACLAAVQDREVFLVIFPGGTLDETTLCVTEENETLALQLAGAQARSLYERSEGRLFNNAMSVNRLFEVMVASLDEYGALEGRTLGIVRPDTGRDQEVAQILKDALAGAGYEIAEEVALPCEGNVCQQNDVAVERFSAAGVDGLFSQLGPVTYPAFVSAAGAAGYTPQWFSSDYENQVFETTARFMEGPREWYHGAIGTTTAVEDPEPDELRSECNEYFTAQTGVEYEVFTDAWRLVGNSCEILTRVDRVIDRIAEQGLELGQNTFIAEMEKERVENGARQGNFGPDKHDAYDVYALLEFDQECICWNEIPGTRKVWSG